MDHKEYKQAADHRKLGLDWKDEEQKAHYERGDVAAHARTGGILDKYSQAVEGTNGEGTALGDYMLGVQKAFTDAGIDEDTFSASMMNLQALRGNPSSKIAMTKSLLSREDDPRLAQGSIRAKLGQAVQRKANEVYGDKAQHKSNPWASTLSRLLRKKRSQQSAGTGRSRSGTIFDSSAVLQ
ncbi:MAG: hypothetical protein K6F53_07340 [Lachnospiraceae bacterium]|nr:hypothetical protein [Lachnospiraceae bacterium]